MTGRELPLVGQAPRSPSTATLPILAKGFRPFFLLAGLHGAVYVPLWLGVLWGSVEAPRLLPASVWHAHAMLFGYGVAVLSGFLLTAVGNWTGRETARGPLLAALCGLWVAGRVATLPAARIPAPLAVALDLAFLPALMVVLGRALLVAKNRRNYGVLVLLAALFGANAVVHAGSRGVLDAAAARTATLVAVDLFVVVMAWMAGRIVPMFTRNATGYAAANRPHLDRAAMGAAVLFAVLEGGRVEGPLRTAMAAGAAILMTLRAQRWGAAASRRDPLLWVLHAGYACIPLGYAARAFADVAAPAYASVATHLHTAGALGLLSVGMMVRVALGHTGRPLKASRAAVLAFVLCGVAAAARSVLPVLGGPSYPVTLLLAGAAWTLACVAFLRFALPVCLRPRVDGKPG